MWEEGQEKAGSSAEHGAPAKEEEGVIVLWWHWVHAGRWQLRAAEKQRGGLAAQSCLRADTFPRGVKGKPGAGRLGPLLLLPKEGKPAGMAQQINPMLHWGLPLTSV